ncbi:MAG: hypothetical protein JXM72_10330, partial [Deltaproteobacteria bacterium]|nr:hypothetical protein [Deltaproteobacteria bacterium]
AYPSERGVHYNYAVSLIGARQHTLAENHLLMELNISGERYELLKTLGELYYTSSNPIKAVACLKKALKHCVDEKESSIIEKKIATASDSRLYSNMLKADTLFAQAAHHLDNDQWKESRTLFEQALHYDRDNPLIYNNLGVISLNHEKAYMRAKDYFEKALVLSDLPIIKRNLAKAEFFIHKEARAGRKAYNTSVKEKA